MPWAAGSYTKGNNGTGGWVGDASLGIGIEAGRHDTQDNDFATGINQCLNKDGSNSCTGDFNLGGFKPVNVAAGTAAAPAICAGGDVNTGIFSPAADEIGIATNGSERVRIDASGNIGIGTTSPISSIDITRVGGGGAFVARRFDNGTAAVEIGITKSRGTTAGSNVIVQNGDAIGNIIWYGANGTSYTPAALIQAAIDGAPGASNDMPGRLVFSTTADNSGTLTERMRIDNGGSVIFGKSSTSNSVAGAHILSDVAGRRPLYIIKTDSGTVNGILFYHNGSYVGGLNYSDSATSLVTSSDYRLKENVKPINAGIETIQKLKPCTFNFKVTPEENVAGFIAHELQEVVPSAVFGDKDATEIIDGEEKIKPQSIDTNKLIPFLTAAIQELNAKVEVLEAKVAELEA